MADASWHDRGEQLPERVEEQKHAQQFGNISRYWVPVSEHGRGIFLDDEKFCIDEHSLFMNGNWRNFFTCIRKIEGRGCPLDAVSKPYYIGFRTVVDIKPWQDKKTKEWRKNFKRLLGFKTADLNKMEELKKLHAEQQDDGQPFSLVGTEWDFFRSHDKAGSAGDTFTFIKRHPDLQAYFKDELERQVWKNGLAPFDYGQILRPKAYEELARIAARYQVQSEAAASGTSAAPQDADEQIPF